MTEKDAIQMVLSEDREGESELLRAAIELVPDSESG